MSDTPTNERLNYSSAGAVRQNKPPRTQPAASERVQRYTEKLDAALDLMAPAERLPELRSERVRWIARSEQFVADIDAGKPIPFGADLSDYDDVIALLGKRIDLEERKQAVIPVGGVS